MYKIDFLSKNRGDSNLKKVIVPSIFLIKRCPKSFYIVYIISNLTKYYQ